MTRRPGLLPMLFVPLVAMACTQTPLNAMQPAIQAKPGFSAERLQRLDRFLQKATGRHGYPGAVALVWRHGQVAYVSVHGHRDRARTQPMQRDSIFRIHSMTKTIASVAALMLVEEGRLALEDPVGLHLPAFAHPQVVDGGSPETPRLRAAAHTLTVHHLLTHTSGFAGGDGQPAVERLRGQVALEMASDLRAYAGRLARVPLAAEPGTRFGYDSANTELLSRLVEVVSGQPFEQYLRQRILTPLGMRDTGFQVPAAQRHRIVELTTMNAQGQLVQADVAHAHAPGTRLRPYASGAGGLYSTVDDYARFAAMLLEGGSLDGTVILGRKTVESMMRNHLTHLPRPVTQFSDAEGFGLGGSVLLDAARRGRLGSAGQFGWSGAASTYYSIDPEERMFAILLMQHLPSDHPGDLPRVSSRFYNVVYQALLP